MTCKCHFFLSSLLFSLKNFILICRGASFLTSSSPNTSGSQPLVGSYNNNPNIPPLLLAGTKQDQAELNRISTSSKRLFGYKADMINLNCLQQNHLAPGSSNSIILAKFFDKVRSFLFILFSSFIFYINHLYILFLNNNEKVIDFKRSQKNREVMNNNIQNSNLNDFVSIQVEKPTRIMNHESNHESSNLFSRTSLFNSNANRNSSRLNITSLDPKKFG